MTLILTEENPKLGEALYPVDNSYSNCLSEKQEFTTRLAGMINTAALPCRIISLPYNKKVITATNIERIHEFVVVEHDNKAYEVLNIFHENYDVMASHIKQLDIF